MNDAIDYAAKTTANICRGDQVYDALDKRLHRFDRVEPDGMIALLHGNTLLSLPDLRHPTQIAKASPNAATIVEQQQNEWIAAHT